MKCSLAKQNLWAIGSYIEQTYCEKFAPTVMEAEKPCDLLSVSWKSSKGVRGSPRESEAHQGSWKSTKGVGSSPRELDVHQGS